MIHVIMVCYNGRGTEVARTESEFMVGELAENVRALKARHPSTIRVTVDIVFPVPGYTRNVA
jgi:hypothetical protein